jgi:hypothetical protein
MACNLFGGSIGRGMDLRQRLAGSYPVPALAEADDADRVVDRVVLRPAPGAEMERSLPDGDRPQRGDVAVAIRCDLEERRRRRQRVFGRVAVPCADSAFGQFERQPVGDRLRGPHAPFLLVDAEVRHREQS